MAFFVLVGRLAPAGMLMALVESLFQWQNMPVAVFGEATIWVVALLSALADASQCGSCRELIVSEPIMLVSAYLCSA